MSQVTLQEAVDMNYASRATIMRRKADGTLHPVKRGRLLYFDTEELDDVFRNEGLNKQELREFVRVVRREAPHLTSEQALDLIKYIYETCIHDRDRKRKRKRTKGNEQS